MADFDDLIPKSSHVNPFASSNPFADVPQRPRSPDPWSMGASYYDQAPPPPAAHSDVFGSSAHHFDSGFGDVVSSNSNAARYDEPQDDEEVFSYEAAAASPVEPEPELQPVPSVDPLDSHLKEDSPPPTRRTGSFAPLPVVRASTPPPKAPAVKVPERSASPVPAPAAAEPELDTSIDSKAEVEDVSSSPPPTDATAAPSPPTTSQPEISPEAPSSPTPAAAAEPTPAPLSNIPLDDDSSTPHQEPAQPSPPVPAPSNIPAPAPAATTPRPKSPERPSIISPLTSPNYNAHTLNRSFSGLALGGEAHYNGWGGHSSPSTFEPPAPAANKAYRAVTPAEEEYDDEDDRPLGVGRVGVVRETTQPTFDPRDVEPLPDVQPVTISNEPRAPAVDFLITVGDPQKVGDPISAHIVYTVTTKTNDPTYKKSSFSVLRRYSDFLWLFDALQSNNPGIIIPPVPEKNPFGRFAEHFVEARRLALNRCLEKIVRHERLKRDADLRMFLESDSFALDIKHRARENQSGLIASIGSTITGPKFYETDEWFDKRKAYLDALESQLKTWIKAIEMVGKQRNEIITAISEFADAVSILGSSDLSKQLSNSLIVLADVERKGKELMEQQSRHDLETVLGTVEEYLRLIASIRLAFASRIKLFYAWKAADAERIRVRNMHEKTLRQRGLDRQSIIPIQREIEQVESKAQEAKNEYDETTKLIKVEVARFEHERVNDFKASLDAFLEGMINRQTEIVDAWEQYQQLLLKRAGQNPTSA